MLVLDNLRDLSHDVKSTINGHEASREVEDLQGARPSRAHTQSRWTSDFEGGGRRKRVS